MESTHLTLGERIVTAARLAAIEHIRQELQVSKFNSTPIEHTPQQPPTLTTRELVERLRESAEHARGQA